MKAATQALAAATCALIATGCIGGSEGGVTLLGDSITSLASLDVTERLRDFDSVKDNAVWGIRVDEQIPTAEEIADRRPDQVVLNLGTNDVVQGRDSAAIIEDYGTVLDLLDDISCVHVVTLNEHMKDDSTLGAKAAEVNVGIRALAAEHDNVTVTEWSQIFAYPADNGLLMEDKLHPNEEGAKKLGGVMAMMAQSCDLPEDN
ncbi:MAG: SGNH/GDSL hydrolase family protein [Actinobacteria bacterium]|nr:SGNH/GDSL hydrolase family protein [Actinomycetota bacterium]